MNDKYREARMTRLAYWTMEYDFSVIMWRWWDKRAGNTMLSSLARVKAAKVRSEYERRQAFATQEAIDLWISLVI